MVTELWIVRLSKAAELWIVILYITVELQFVRLLKVKRKLGLFIITAVAVALLRACLVMEPDWS